MSLPACLIIEDRAFEGCSNLTSVNISNCTYIGNSAFYSCKNLTQINLSKCERICDSAFWSCPQLTTISLPVCSYIGSYAFNRCSALQSLYLLSTAVVSLGGYDTAIQNTPLSLSTYTGSFGSIYVPSSLLTAYKSARN
jgi:hypothetical protein